MRGEAVDRALLHRRGDVAVPQTSRVTRGRASILAHAQSSCRVHRLVIAPGTRTAPWSSPKTYASARARSREIAPRSALWALSTLCVSLSMTRALSVLVTLVVCSEVMSTARRRLILPAVVDCGVEHGCEQDVDLGDGVGRQRFAESGLVLAARYLQLAVVGGDPGCGELVDVQLAEVGRDVVAQDLSVTVDGRVLQPQLEDGRARDGVRNGG